MGSASKYGEVGILQVFAICIAFVLCLSTSAHPQGLATPVDSLPPVVDSDGDGMLDNYELANGLNPEDPADAQEDNDADRLTNLQEAALGTNPNEPDTDGDGVTDSTELERGTNPSLPPEPSLDETCVATVLNRTVQVDADGTFSLSNIPVPIGALRVRVVCEDDEGVSTGQSEFVLGVPNGDTLIGNISFAQEEAPLPVSLNIASPAIVLTPAASGAQLVTTGTLADGLQIDLTLSDSGTFYLSSNPAIATVSADGFVNAVSSGNVLITATHEGVIATIALTVDFVTDADGDGIPDDFEQTNAVDPGGANLARLAGTQVVASSNRSGSPPDRAIDGSLLTSWFTASGDAANRGSSPFIEVILPVDVNVAQIRLFGNREEPEGFDFFAGIFQAFDQAGVELFNSGGVALPAPNRDVAVSVDVNGVRRVRFTSVADESGRPGLSEIEVISRPGGPGLNPNDPSDANLDFDGDGLTNLEEFNLGTSLFLQDTDADGLDDSEEVSIGSSPLLGDTDNDGLLDGLERSPSADTDGDGLINIVDPDSDNDGLPDGVEIILGLDPLRVDTDFDGIPDGSEDSDGDGLPNGEEILENTDPNNPDTDGDGTPDGEEVLSGCNPLIAETTTVVGRALDEQGDPISGAVARVVGRTASVATDSGGFFSLPGSPACRDLRAQVDALRDGTRLRGLSPLTSPVVDGTTDVGDILLGQLRGPLYPGPKYRVGSSLRWVSVADLNTDGSPDLVTASGGSDVSVLLGNGDGTFQPRQVFTATSGPQEVRVVDLNTDGVLDLVTANFSGGSVSILLGRGDGTFEPEQRFSAGRGPISVGVSDLNEDGSLDVVTANFFSNDVSVILGNPLGGFQAEQRLAVGVRPRSVAVADLNGDGSLDLVTANSTSNDISVLFGNRFGNFQAEERLMVGGEPFSVATDDLNADGIDDVVTANRVSDDLSVLLGSTDGAFLGEERLSVAAGPRSVRIVDLNGDAKLDVVATNEISDEVSVFFGNGDGTFQPEQRSPTGRLPDEVAFGDVDLDGVIDLVTSGTTHVTLLLGVGDGTFLTQEFLDASQPNDVTIADLNVDGNPDIISADAPNVSAFLGNGDGSFQPPGQFAAGDLPTAIAAADLNSDGLPDVVASNQSNDVSLLLGLGNGSFQSQRRFSTGRDPGSLAIADFDGNGDLDVVTGNRFSDDVSVLLGFGNGSFAAEQRLDVGDQPRGVTAADLNGDGAVDIATANRVSDDVSILFGNGDGTFQVEQRLAAGNGPGDIAATDLNGDGFVDLIVANQASDDISVFLADGVGGFPSEQRLGAGDGPASVTMADVNRDGIADIVALNGLSRDVSVIQGNGDGTFQDELRFDTGDQSLATGDLNRDGRPDFVTVLITGGFFEPRRERISVLLSRVPSEDTLTGGPTVTITSPSPNDSVTEGTTVPVVAEAVGDNQILRVDFLANGVVVATDTKAPYQADVTVPIGATSVTIGATATDLLGDVGVAEEVVLNVLPSPPPTVTITSPAPGFDVIEGTLLPITVEATDDLGVASVDFLVDGQVVFTDLAAPYGFDLTVPTGIDTLTLGARATDIANRVGVASEIVGNVLPDNPPTVTITSPAPGANLTEGALVPIRVDATDDVEVVSVDFLVDGALVFTDTAAPYEFELAVPTGVSSLTLGASAQDSGGNTGIAIDVSVNVAPDPGTTVDGRVIDTDGAGVDGASISVFGRSSTTLADGSFSISGVATVLGDIVVEATATVTGLTLTGVSAPAAPVASGITDVGVIVLRINILFSTDFQASGASGSAVRQASGTGLRPSNVYRSSQNGTNVLELSGSALGIEAFTDSNIDGIAVRSDGSFLFTTSPGAFGAPGSAVEAAQGTGLAEANLYRSTGDGTNELFISGDSLGIVPFTGSNINGISLLSDSSILFTVDSGANGVPGSALEAAASTGLVEANIYRSTGNGTNELFVSGADLGIAAFTSSDIDGIARLPDGSILFTTDLGATGVAGSALEAAATSGLAAAHIYRSTGTGTNELFISGDDIGTIAGDDVDGVTLP